MGRDLKPENIVFTDDSISSTLKVIDFGGSRLMSPKQEMKDFTGSLYYMAPEVLAAKSYNEKCDMWSCGVLMYLLLSGVLPFCVRSREEIIAATAGKVEFFHPNWKRVSADAKQLILQLLTYDPTKRISAAKALQHPWIIKNAAPDQVSSLDLCNIVSNLKNFKVQLVFQQTVLSYLASQQMQYDEENNIRRFFSFLDFDKDGRLSKQDLVHGLSRVCTNKYRVIKEVEHIMKNMDVDHNMLIDYNGSSPSVTSRIEFLVANLHIDHAITTSSLRQAFAFFDEVRCPAANPARVGQEGLHRYGRPQTGVQSISQRPVTRPNDARN